MRIGARLQDVRLLISEGIKNIVPEMQQICSGDRPWDKEGATAYVMETRQPYPTLEGLSKIFTKSAKNGIK